MSSPPDFALPRLVLLLLQSAPPGPVAPDALRRQLRPRLPDLPARALPQALDSLARLGLLTLDSAGLAAQLTPAGRAQDPAALPA